MKNFLLIASIVLIIVLPFALRKDLQVLSSADDTLVVITPHDEGIRHEFEAAFARHYHEATGRTVDIDWRVIGGTSEIIRYLQSTYTNNFRFHWERNLGKTWSGEVQNSFMNRRVQPAKEPSDDNPEQSAKRAFLGSSVGSGIDILFGGGSYDFIQLGRSGMLIPFADPDQIKIMLPEDEIPALFSGEPFYDPVGLWAGAVLSQFGIIYNTHSLSRLAIPHPPAQWADLTDPRFLGELAISDPVQSGSSTKAFEMIVQQIMLARVRTLGPSPTPDAVASQVAKGWLESMRQIQLICANARYFTDSSKKPSIDVSAGECAAGMSIDFYGRFQSETLLNRTGSDRFQYVTPHGGSTVSVDPIAILRGAPNEDLAKQFVAFVMSSAGQKVWNWKVGTPGGPERYALRRSPMPRSLYQDEYLALRSDPDINPYEETGSFVYHPEWTERLFSPLRFIIKTAFMDPHDELKEAWRSIIEARNEGRIDDADRALAVLQDLSSVDYKAAAGGISNILNQRTKISEVRLAREITLQFRDRYLRTAELARGGKPGRRE